jgi:hypothetical protein
MQGTLFPVLPPSYPLLILGATNEFHIQVFVKIAVLTSNVKKSNIFPVQSVKEYILNLGAK